MFLPGHVNHSIFWKNLAPIKVSKITVRGSCTSYNARVNFWAIFFIVDTQNSLIPTVELTSRLYENTGYQHNCKPYVAKGQMHLSGFPKAYICILLMIIGTRLATLEVLHPIISEENFAMSLMGSVFGLTGRRRCSSWRVVGICYWGWVWFSRNSKSEDGCWRCRSSRIRLGGMHQLNKLGSFWL